MKLSNKEQKELKLLTEIQQGNYPMPKSEYDRLDYLNKKSFHKCCPNSQCTGYEGNLEDNYCPKCGYQLTDFI